MPTAALLIEGRNLRGRKSSYRQISEQGAPLAKDLNFYANGPRRVAERDRDDPRRPRRGGVARLSGLAAPCVGDYRRWLRLAGGHYGRGPEGRRTHPGRLRFERAARGFRVCLPGKAKGPLDPVLAVNRRSPRPSKYRHRPPAQV